jgi:hypothetical protein
MNRHVLSLRRHTKISWHRTLTLPPDGCALLATRSDVAARSIITFLPAKAVATTEIRQLTRSDTETCGYDAKVAI